MTDFNYRALCAKLLDELEYHTDWSIAESLKAEASAACRPKPPSLVEKAFDAWDRLRNEAWCQEIDFDLNAVRAALERLQELEKGNE